MLTAGGFRTGVRGDQWRKISEALKANSADQLIVEGYAYYDEDLEAMALLCQSATTREMQRQRYTKPEADPSPPVPQQPSVIVRRRA